MPPFCIEWLEDANVDVRKLDRPTALRVFDGILHYTKTGAGDVIPLHGKMAGAFRLRIGDDRVLFMLSQNTMHIFGVRPRSGAYR